MKKLLLLCLGMGLMTTLTACYGPDGHRGRDRYSHDHHPGGWNEGGRWGGNGQYYRNTQNSGPNNGR